MGNGSNLKAEAAEPLRQGVIFGMFSNFADNEKPKYVWSVDADGEVYEAKIDSYGYHGYRFRWLRVWPLS